MLTKLKPDEKHSFQCIAILIYTFPYGAHKKILYYSILTRMANTTAAPLRNAGTI